MLTNGLRVEAEVVGQTCIWQVLAEHNLRRKKSGYIHERDSARVQQARAAYVGQVQTRSDVARFTASTGQGCAWTTHAAMRALLDSSVSAGPNNVSGGPLTLFGTLSVHGLGASQLLKGAGAPPAQLCFLRDSVPGPYATPRCRASAR